MCGIVGYIGHQNATEIIMDGLKKLEYRGYDSAGVAVRTNGHVTIKRAEGKLANLASVLQQDMPKGTLGIGHTRWATHGRPSENNAHPHRAGRVIVVHNGIIENHVSIQNDLAKKGCAFESDTDTEIICHLVNDYLSDGSTFLDAMRKALQRISGSYAFVMMDANDAETLYFARKRSPLVIGVGEKESFVASDIPAILAYTRHVIFIDDNEVGRVQSGAVEVFNAKGERVEKKPQTISWNPLMAQKGGYKHFMLKEIFEQADTIADCLAGRVLPGNQDVVLSKMDRLCVDGHFPFKRIYMVACGTSWHAAKVARYWIEEYCRIPVTVELGSEFRYRHPIIDENMLVIAISQSGETADTLAGVELAKEAGAKVLGICNVLGSTLSRDADETIFTHAGPEIGVASTKAFTTQLAALGMLTLWVGLRTGRMSAETVRTLIDEFLQLPRYIKDILDQHERIQAMALDIVDAAQVLFIGRGPLFPVALEGALKLKEISYVHSEGFAGGELKHGPIALIENGLPVVALVPEDATTDKMMSNVEEVKARGATVIGVTSLENSEKSFSYSIHIPKVSGFLAPILYVIPLQLLAYYVADFKGTDVDQPRNLAKSVTVE